MIGNVIFDMLTVPTEDVELGIIYPAWTVCDDKKLQISSDAVVNDKIKRTITSNAEEVIIPIAGNAEINSNMHLTLQTSLKNKEIHLLIDDDEFEYKESVNNKRWGILNSEKKTLLKLPYLETRFMINESVTLNTEYKGGLVKVIEDRSATKDRYMALTMFNFFGEKLKNKYLQDGDSDEIDLDEWAWLSGDYKGF